MATTQKKIPAGFRHLFSNREVKQLEQQIGTHFSRIHFSHLLNTTFYQPEQLIQSAFHPVTISGQQKEGVWLFTISQSGFRRELLPGRQERVTKLQIIDKLSSFVARVMASRETDFLRSPQLMIDITISQNQVSLYSRGNKSYPFSGSF